MSERTDPRLVAPPHVDAAEADRAQEVQDPLRLCVFATLALLGWLLGPWALLGLLAAPLAWRAHAPVRGGALGPALIPALAQTGLAMVVWALATAVGLAIA